MALERMDGGCCGAASALLRVDRDVFGSGSEGDGAVLWLLVEMRARKGRRKVGGSCAGLSIKERLRPLASILIIAKSDQRRRAATESEFCRFLCKDGLPSTCRAGMNFFPWPTKGLVVCARSRNLGGRTILTSAFPPIPATFSPSARAE